MFFENAAKLGHESIHHFQDTASGLRVIIAIHSTALGPAAGGCRRWPYVSEVEAMTDALRLARGMTYKNAIAGLPLGGGKAVMLASADQAQDEELFHAFGRCVESLGGRYITAEDVGASVENMHQVRQVTKYVAGLPGPANAAGGDPSPWTADGVFLGIKVAAEHRFGATSLKDVRVAVQGVGKVGYDLCRQLHGAGAQLVISDVNAQNLSRAQGEFDAQTVSPEQILYQDVDVLAPCAMGAILNTRSIPKIRAKVIAGSANNQLADTDDGARLADRNILYAPDYVINGGGIISVALEYMGDRTSHDTREAIALIPVRLTDIFTTAAAQHKPTNVVADAMAERIVAAGISV